MMHNFLETISSLLIPLEANRDDELFAPSIVEGYVALAKALDTPLEDIYNQRNVHNTSLPLIAQLYHPELMAEWDWVTQFTSELSNQVVAIEPTQTISAELFDVNASEVKSGFKIMVLT